MSAVVLMTVALGVLKALDTSSVASANLKRRSVAASVGQKDQERLRAMLASDLAGLDQTRTILSNGISFTVHSTATWIFDGAGTTDCTTNISNDYLKISSTVTWPSMGVGRAAVEDSIVSPPVGSFTNDEGSISATVIKATGLPAVGIPVTVSGGASASGVTNSAGCVIFGHLPVGNGYTVSVNKPGWVDHNGNQNVSQATSVVAQTTNSVSFDYDVSSAIDATFDTRRFRTTATGTVWPSEPAKADRMRVGNGGLAAPFYKGYGTANTWLSAISAEPLFPFTDGYRLYAGDCNANDPAVQVPAQVASVSITPPGGRDPETVRMPALDVQVRRKIGGGTLGPLNSARVRITPTSAGCSTTKLTRTTAKIIPAGGTAAQGVNGLFADYGLPYGTYNVCADDSTAVQPPTRLNRFQQTTVTLNKGTLTAAIPPIDIRDTAPISPAGTCP